jgi:hypothetical protein
MSWEQLLGLTSIFSSKSLETRVKQKYLEWQEIFSEEEKVRSGIRKYRTQFGLIDLEIVRKRFNMKDATLIRIISEIYPRSIKSGNLVLARLANRTTMFEFSIAKQLKVHSPLTPRDLLIGLHRSGKQRDVSLIGSNSDLSRLIEVLAGNPPTYEVASKGLLEAIEFRSVEKWLIEIFLEANLGVLHSNDVINLALRDKEINVNSVNVYLSNSPIIRAHGRALYSLVGTEVDEDALDAYVQIVRGSSEASEVSYEVIDGSRGVLSVKPNINVITNGIVYPPTGFKKIFEGYQFKTSCQCKQLETMQAVKFAPSGFWTGFTAMIRHGFSHHQMSKNSIFRFEFDFDSSVVRLLVN